MAKCQESGGSPVAAISGAAAQVAAIPQWARAGAPPSLAFLSPLDAVFHSGAQCEVINAVSISRGATAPALASLVAARVDRVGAWLSAANFLAEEVTAAELANLLRPSLDELASLTAALQARMRGEDQPDAGSDCPSCAACTRRSADRAAIATEEGAR